jgi:hypothetical protein
VASGSLRTRAQSQLAADAEAFLVVGATAVVRLTLRTDARLYREGAAVQVTGEITNSSAAAQSGLTLAVTNVVRETTLHQEPFSLAPGAARAYAFETLADAGANVDEEEEDFERTVMTMEARVRRGSSTLARVFWSVTVGKPDIDLELLLPDPPARLVPTAVRLVEAAEGELDAVTKTDGGSLDGSFPFPVEIAGTEYSGFRQSVDGFVELVPRHAEEPSGASEGCLADFGTAHVVAAALGDLDASQSGFAGYKVYAAGTTDAEGGQALYVTRLPGFGRRPASCKRRSETAEF